MEKEIGKNFKDRNDLTVGSPLKKIALFMLPLFIGNIFQQLYSMVDSLIVDRTLGTAAFSGVGITGSLSFLVLGFAQGLTAGLGVITAQHFGAKDESGVRRSMATSWILCAVLSVILTIVSYFLAAPLLRLMNTPEEYFSYSYDYISVIFLGLGASVFYNMASYMLRSLGDSKTPLYFLILACVLNVGLDFLFVKTFKAGVAGAGWATVISQLAAGAACLCFMYKKYPEVRPKKQDWKTNAEFCFRHLKTALPMGFQFSVIAVGIMIQQSAINGLGNDVIVAYTAAVKADNIATQAFVALGAAMATYCGQNYGAREYGRLKTGVNRAVLCGLIISVTAAALISIFGKFAIRVFASQATEEQINLGEKYLTYQGIFYIFLMFIYVYRNSLQGIGYSGITVFAGILELTMRGVAAFVLVNALSFDGVCLSNPVAWIGADLVLLPAYFFVMRKLLTNRGGVGLKPRTVNRK